MYHQIGNSGLHLSAKVPLRTTEFGKIELLVLTNELSRTHGPFKFVTQINGGIELHQRLKAGFIQHYYTEDEAKQGHQEIIRKLRNREFQLIPEMYSLVIEESA